MPERIQRKRVAGWRMPHNTVYVGRPTKWGNPWPVTKPSECPDSHEWFYHRFAVEAFRRWIERDEQDELRADIRKELKGKNLACWCREDLPCHADVLLEIANSREDIF